jgi:hypothetical protein
MLLDELQKIKDAFDKEGELGLAGWKRPSRTRLADIERSVALYILAMRKNIKLDMPADMPDMDMIEIKGMLAKTVLFAGSPCVLACDAKCHKAWGSERPRVYVGGDPNEEGISEREMFRREDDWAQLADHELGEAPVDNGWYEGDHAKPTSPDERLNKWCARQCERSVLVDVGKPIELPDFNHRFFNCAPHTRIPDELSDADRTPPTT